MRFRREILVGGLLFMVLSVSVTLMLPTLDDLFIENKQWNGLSEFYKDIKPVRLYTSDGIRNLESNSTLYIVGPSRDFSGEDIEAIKVYLESGGRVVLADDFGTGNQLLEGLGLETRFSGDLLMDSVFYRSVPEFPRLLNFTTFDVKEVVLNYATVLLDGEELQVLESSSPLSYLESDNGELEAKSYPILGWIAYGDGRLFLISDASMFINTMIGEPYNQVLLQRSVQGRAYVDTSHSVPSSLLRVKWGIDDLYQYLDGSFLLYFLVFGFSFVFVRGIIDSPVESVVGEVERVLSRFPEWDRERLGWLVEQRETH